MDLSVLLVQIHFKENQFKKKSRLQYYQHEVGLLQFVTARNNQGQHCQVAAGSELIGETGHRQTQVQPLL